MNKISIHHNSDNNSKSEFRNIDERNQLSLNIVNGSDNGTISKSKSSFDPNFYMSLLTDNPLPNPIKITSEKDLNKEMELVTNGLSNQEDWQERINALLKLQGILRSSYCVESENLIGSIKTLIDQISSNINDLRSAISKEASKTVALLTVLFGTKVSQLIDVWLPLLIKQVSVKIQVIAISADRSIRIIISSTNSGYPKIISVLNDIYFGTKNQITRKHCIDYLILICCLWSKDVIDKNITIMKHLLKSSLTDADQLTRKSGRYLYWILASNPTYQSQMNEFLSSLDDKSLQKHIILEKKQLTTELSDALKLLSSNNMVNVSVGYDFYCNNLLDKATSVTPLSNNSQNISSRNMSTLRKSSVLSSRPTSALAMTAPQRINKSLDEENYSHDNHIKSNTNNIEVNEKNDLITDSLGNDSNYDLDDDNPIDFKKNIINRRGSLAPPMRLPVNTSNDNSTSRRMSIMPMTNGNSNEDMNSSIILSNPQRNIPINNLTSNSINQNQSKLLISTGPQRITKTIQSNNNTISIVPTNNTPIPTNNITKNNTNVINTNNTAINQKKSNEIELTVEIIKKLFNDSNWQSKLQIYELINTKLSTLLSFDNNYQNLLNISLDVIDNIIDVTIQGISDTHNKIATEAMTVISNYIKIYNNSICNNCNDLTIYNYVSKVTLFLIPLFTRLSDRRANIRDLAMSLLNQIRSSYDPNILIATLSNKLIDVSNRLRLPILQYITTIISYCNQYFSNYNNLSTFINRIVSYKVDKTSDTLYHPIQQIFELLYKLLPIYLCQVISSLPLQSQFMIKQLLSSTIPDIEQIIKSNNQNRVLTSRNTNIKANNINVDNNNQLNYIINDRNDSDASKENYDTTEQLLSNKNYSSIKTKVVANKPMINELDKYINEQLNHITLSPNITTVPITTSSNIPKNNSSNQLNNESILKSDNQQITNESNNEIIRLSDYLPKVPSSQSIVGPPKTPVTTIKPLTKPENKDFIWLLSSLRASASIEIKREAMSLLRVYIKTETNQFWQMNTSQVVSVLLEAFNPILSSIYQIPSALTGLSPSNNNSPIKNNNDSNNHMMKLNISEHMHLSCKSLSLLVKHQGVYVKDFMDLLFTRLCEAASYAPVAITLYNEQILSDLTPFNSLKAFQLLIPFTNLSFDSDNKSFPHFNSKYNNDKDQEEIDNAKYESICLMALHILVIAIKGLTSTQLLNDIVKLLDNILPLLYHNLADIRKAVIFILVEIYFVIGDALYPYLLNMSLPHKKLLTIYIEKSYNNRNKIK